VYLPSSFEKSAERQVPIDLPRTLQDAGWLAGSLVLGDVRASCVTTSNVPIWIFWFVVHTNLQESDLEDAAALGERVEGTATSDNKLFQDHHERAYLVLNLYSYRFEKQKSLHIIRIATSQIIPY
jgi:hypothetical protein